MTRTKLPVMVMAGLTILFTVDGFGQNTSGKGSKGKSKAKTTTSSTQTGAAAGQNGVVTNNNSPRGLKKGGQGVVAMDPLVKVRTKRNVASGQRANETANPAANNDAGRPAPKKKKPKKP